VSEAVRGRIRGFYGVVDEEDAERAVALARRLVAGGAGVVQVRLKRAPARVLLAAARAVREVTAAAGVPLVVNDRLDVALAAGADGVHLGQEDLPIEFARKLLGNDKIIGISSATIDEARQADVDGADYIAVGAIYPTQSKEDTRPAGLATLRQVRQLTKRPIVAIGGITVDNVEAVLAAGADAIAVISSVVSAPDPQEAARQLSQSIWRHSEPDSSSA